MSKLSSALRALPLLSVLAATAVHAQVVPPTEHSERAVLAALPHPEQITASISSGATLNGGNTKSFAATVGGRLQLIRMPHQFMVEGLGTYTAARAADDNRVHPTATNVIGRARYDIYLSENNALFAALAPRADRFAGLDLRLQMQVGYLRNLYKPADNHRLWFEVGYDGTYDNFSRWLPHGAPPPMPMPNAKGSDFVHSGRGFLGYTNLLTPLATLNLGVELLYDFEDSDNVRVNTTAEITSSISTRFKLSLLSRMLFDNVPVPTKEKTDYITTAQLVFTYDSITPPPACKACDCSDEVAAAKSSCRRDTTVSPGDLPPSAYIPGEEPATPSAVVQPAPAQPAPAKPTP
jgi:putative salt-induced outer membrane protein YdiY